jgi:HEAT repeat protein
MSLTRSLMPVALFALAVLLSPARAEDDDPALRGRKLSAWIDLLQNGKNVETRLAGLKAVQIIGPRKSRKVVPAVLAAVRENSEEKIRAAATLAVGEMARTAREDDDFPLDKTRDALAAALRTDKSGQVREAAAKALGLMKDKARGAAGVLATALKDPHAGTRTAAASSLRILGPEAREAVGELQVALKDVKLERLTRVHCALALGRVGSPDGLPAVPTLAEVLGAGKNDAELRKACAESLGQLGKEAAEAVPTLAAVLTNRDADVPLRRACAEALDQMGADARPALAALRMALKDDDVYVRSLSLHAISRMGGELGDDRKAAILGILTCMDDNALEVRVAAIEALGNLGADNLGEQAKAVTNRLTEASRDPQKAVAEAAHVALKKLQGS